MSLRVSTPLQPVKGQLGLPALAWVVLPLVALGLSVVLPNEEGAHAGENAPLVHLFITSSAAFLAFLSALLVGRAALQLKDTRVLFLTLALMSIGGFFTEHGLATPGVFMVSGYGEGSLSGLMAFVSLLSASVFFSLSVVPWGPAAKRWLGQRAGLWILLFTLAIVTFDLLALRFHTYLDRIPITHHQLVLAWIVTALTISLLLFAAYRYWQSYLLARLPMQWALIMGLLLLVTTQLVMTASHKWTWFWWEYHALMLSGFLVILGGLLYEFGRGRSLPRIMKGVLRLESLVQTELEHSDTIAALAAATEAKDHETQGHTARVAEISVRLGESLRLPRENLRILARAALLHDIGKLGTPDTILLKPGPLTEEEWQVMRQHPDQGHDILHRAGSLERESALIRMHHERLDGKGYPRGLAASNIPLEARIIAIADVYDSLVSDRAYRRRLPPERAAEILREEGGAHLDPELVQVWLGLAPRYHQELGE